MANIKLPEIYTRSLYKSRYAPHSRELTEPVEITLRTGKVICIPVGFRTDGATVPRLFWNIVSPYGNHELATLVHDYLLDTGHQRRYADREMLHWLKESNVGFIKRNLMYLAVRLYSQLKLSITFLKNLS